jgi:kynurenine formamidase
MCNHPDARQAGWLGWAEMPSAALSASAAPWIDLSHALSADLDRIHFLPEPRFERIVSLPEGVANITEIQMVCHFGTHIDAPVHFIADGPAMHEIPLDRLYGSGVVLKLNCAPHAVMEAAQLEASGPGVRPGDIVLLDTGWAAKMGTEAYEQHPSLGETATRWLIERRVKLLGVDFSTPDLTARRRPEKFDFPVHHALLSRGVLIAEHLTNLSPLAGQRIDAMLCALNIRGADGAPTRVLARPAVNG